MAAVAWTWVKSSYSDGYEESKCVEVALGTQVTAVRDSKAPSAGNLLVPAQSWQVFLARWKA
ncbi:DUF397 domain-containing protein [Amycolatopsis sp. CA-230715]|uniref:DUF397 domain-containing protein n=1 Tax=Amycolatopsis sp. CA-230715 TaxID=2745196 RepID=UPI001C02DF91|nr:DUF397 domain-containing protein [Amycolatopsis sp. CA-230715]QWF84699.1 hypothetical protein HUW46_08151 [Amycolatopsis sp. CA-230715]